MSNEVRQYKSILRPATYEDCLSLAPNLRKEDKDEVWESSGMLPEEALIYCFGMNPNAVVGTVEGEVVCMFGVSKTDNPLVGVPWLLGSDRIRDFSREFLQQNKTVLGGLSSGFTTLTNYVWSRNKEHMRWLKWLGFTINYAPQYLGKNQEIFYIFHKNLKE